MDTKEKNLVDESHIRKHFMKLVSSLNTDSNQSVDKALVQLRADIMKYPSCNKHLCDTQSFKVITRYLKFPNEKILSLTLSILATCCLEEEPRRQVMECEAIPHIASVLMHISQDGVQNRACRLVANLAQSKDIVHELHKYKVVEPIVAILNSNTSSGTQQSAIRALRLLWESLPSKDWCIREAMLKSYFAAKVVGEKLKSENEEVARCALKTLKVFSENRGASLCAAQLDGTVYTALVAKLDDPIACQIAATLSKSVRGLMQLNQCFAVRQIVRCLASSASLKEEKSRRQEYLLTCILCLLCCECSGRVQLLTHSEGPSVFLEMLDKQRSPEIKKQLYYILWHFTPEPVTLTFLTKKGLVPILVSKIERFIDEHGKPHQSADKRKKAPTSTSSDDQNCRQMTSSFSPRSNEASTSRSPSGASPDVSLGSLSPFSDPYSLSPAPSDRSNSPTFAYSPVCSSSGIDSDEDNGVLTDSFEENDLETVESHFVDNNILQEDNFVSYFLEKLSYIDEALDDVASVRTIEAIIKYKSQVPSASYRVVNFLQTIVTKEQYYCQLLNQQLALKIHRAWCRPTHSSCCSHCDKLLLAGESVLQMSVALSESGLGEGEMAHKLLKAPDEVRFQIAVTVPLVLRKYKLLIRMLYKYKAYEILTKPLKENTASAAQLEDIAFSMQALFRTLDYKSPQSRTSNKCSGCDILGLRHGSSVTFSLDDGSLVPASKSVLCDNSPVFEAMFRGGFRESEETQVRISDVTSGCLQHFVRLVDVYCECTLPDDVSTLLELVSVADRFLVAGLSNKVLSHVMNNKLNHRSCQDIYKWAVESKLALAENISSDVIKYIFTTKMTGYQLKKAVSSMLAGVYRDFFLRDVSDMIRGALHNPHKPR